MKTFNIAPMHLTFQPIMFLLSCSDITKFYIQLSAAL